MRRFFFPFLFITSFLFGSLFAQTPFTEMKREQAQKLHLKNYAVRVAETSEQYEDLIGHEMRSGMFRPDGQPIKSRVVEVDYVYAIYEKEYQYDGLDRMVRENRTETLMGSEGPVDKPDSAYIKFEFEGAQMDPTYSYYHNIVNKEDLERYGMRYYYDKKNRKERISHFDLNVKVEAMRISVVESFEYNGIEKLWKETYRTEEEREQGKTGTVVEYKYDTKNRCIEKREEFPSYEGTPIRKRKYMNTMMLIRW